MIAGSVLEPAAAPSLQRMRSILIRKAAVLGAGTMGSRIAAQSSAVIQTLGLDMAKVIVNGGAIALGHPLGCTGAELTASVLQEMQRRHLKYGMVTICIGGGMGAAGIFQNLN